MWFKNLKKWQKGGLIGLGVGVILAVIIILSPHTLGEWVANFHVVFLLIIWTWGVGQHESSLAMAIVEYGGSAAIVIFYGGLGALFGRFQQMASPTWKWSLTALLALFLLFFYGFNVNIAMMLR